MMKENFKSWASGGKFLEQKFFIPIEKKSILTQFLPEAEFIAEKSDLGYTNCLDLMSFTHPLKSIVIVN